MRQEEDQLFGRTYTREVGSCVHVPGIRGRARQPRVVKLGKGGKILFVEYPSGLGNFNDRELTAIETLHLGVELFVTDDEDGVYWK
jgi:hypothetical protein